MLLSLVLDRLIRAVGIFAECGGVHGRDVVLDPLFELLRSLRYYPQVISCLVIRLFVCVFLSIILHLG